jgi:hypothetical protein
VLDLLHHYPSAAWGGALLLLTIGAASAVGALFWTAVAHAARRFLDLELTVRVPAGALVAQVAVSAAVGAFVLMLHPAIWDIILGHGRLPDLRCLGVLRSLAAATDDPGAGCASGDSSTVAPVLLLALLFLGAGLAYRFGPDTAERATATASTTSSNTAGHPRKSCRR